MLLALDSSSTVDSLASLLMATNNTQTRGEIATLLACATDREQVVRVWAAINYHNFQVAGKIREITGWYDYEVLEFLVRVEWSSPKRDLAGIRDARDRAQPYPPGDPRNSL